MNKIKYISLFFKIIFQVLLIAVPVVFIIGWAISPEPIKMFAGMIHINVISQTYLDSILHHLTGKEKLLGFLVSVIPITIKIFIIYSLMKLFQKYEKGQIFSVKNVSYIRNIGFALLLGEIINPVYEAALGFILTLNNPPGHRFSAASFDQTNLSILLIAFLIILISWIMMEGVKLYEEQTLTI